MQEGQVGNKEEWHKDAAANRTEFDMIFCELISRLATEEGVEYQDVFERLFEEYDPEYHDDFCIGYDHGCW